MDAAQRWGLPEGFKPLRFPIADAVKDVARSVVEPGEAVIVTIANENGNVTLLATTNRVITIKSGDSGAGVTGFQTKEYPWEGITNLVLQPSPLNVVIQIHYKTNSGGTVEVGRRARMGKDASDKVMPFDTENGTAAFEALHAVWHHKMLQTTEEQNA